jgi:hypothetical protein
MITRQKNLHVKHFLEGSNAKNYAHVTDVPYSSTYRVSPKTCTLPSFQSVLRKNYWNQSSTNEHKS